jgi:uncharacterized protein YcbX
VPLRLTELRRFPVKSCRGEQLETAVVEPWGLAGDRRWMLVDEGGEAVTIREQRQMVQVHPRLRADGGLTVTAPGQPDLQVPRPSGDRQADVTLFGGRPFRAALAGREADAWFSRHLGAPVRLVFADDPNRRQANPAYAGPGVAMAFGDGYPLMLASEESLAELNALVAAGQKADEGPLSMTRFRPNLVVAGGTAWAEDGWRRLRIGDAVFRGVKGCPRCAIPATDEETGKRFKEPTYTLAKHRRWDGAVWFGMNLVPETPGATLRVGDEVELLDAVDATDGPPR